MEPASNLPPANKTLGHCPYLGLNDDPATSLGYPSPWNYCYRAKPPASILNSHQAETCLGPHHQQCPVFLAEPAPMPDHLRGSNPLPAAGPARAARRVLGWILLAIVLAAAGYLASRFVPLQTLLTPPTNTFVPDTATLLPSLTPTASAVFVDPNAGIIASFTAEARTRIANYTPTIDLTHSPTPSLTPTRTPTPTRTYTPTRTPTRTATPPTRTPLPTSTLSPSPVRSTLTSPALTSSAGPACGHDLDVPFGQGIRFVIHRVLTGENLSVFAAQYKTTTDAIVAVNFHLPLPVWADWIVVIPIGISDISGIPPFEPYQAANVTISTEALVKQLQTDLQLFIKYNDLPASCGMFSGWLLVPHQPTSP